MAPSSHLTEDLRALIRDSKALLIDWVKAANDAWQPVWATLRRWHGAVAGVLRMR